MGYENVGLVWSPNTLREYLYTIGAAPEWCNGITLHHTWEPSLAQRPSGFTAQHLGNLRDYFRIEKGWSAGPHLFVDDDQLWGMCDFRVRGVHAVGWNATKIGIEVLGDYSTDHGSSEDPKTGRGLACWRTAAAGAKVLLDWIGKAPSRQTVTFHRDDGATSKDCPGNLVSIDWVLDLIAQATHGPTETVHGRPSIDVAMAESEWRFVGERWCVPVAAYLQRKGVSMDEIRSALRGENGNFYYNDELLEGAFYDTSTESTWAPPRELVDLRNT